MLYRKFLLEQLYSGVEYDQHHYKTQYQKQLCVVGCSLVASQKINIRSLMKVGFGVDSGH